MLSTLIRRELLDNLMTFRFIATVVIMLLLVVANTFVLINDYDRRLEAYNAAVNSNHERMQERTTYSSVSWDVARSPNLLSIFNVGLDKRLSNEIFVHHGFVPTLWDGQLHGSTNPLLNLFSSIDIVFIFEVVLSLMALIFAYDALAGERERGTLRLVLTHPVSRGKILLAKYISAMMCLLVPLLMSFLLVVILLTTSPIVSLKVDDFLRIGGIVLSSIAYLSNILSHRPVDFSNYPQNKHCFNACDVCLGFFGVGISECDSCCDYVRGVFSRAFGTRF